MRTHHPGRDRDPRSQQRTLAKPLPYPKQPWQQCSSGYVQSGGFCVLELGGTAREAVPRPRGSQCPSGWTASGGACERLR